MISVQERPVRTGLSQTRLFRGRKRPREQRGWVQRSSIKDLQKGGKKTIAPLTRKVVSIPPTFNKCEELFMFDSVAPHVNLQRQQQGEEELVLLVQASRRILVNLKGHKLNDVGDALAGDGAFRGPGGGGERYLRHV